MPKHGETRSCSTHGLEERWCSEHQAWEFYCYGNNCKPKWVDTAVLTATPSGRWRCNCGALVGSGAPANDEVDELFERAKAAYRRENAREQQRIRQDREYAYAWVQNAIGFLTAILNFFTAVWTSNCYITTAMVQHRGLPDDCHELTVLRRFRTEYIAASRDAQKLADLQEYERLGPRVARWLRAHPRRGELLEWVATTVEQAVCFIERGDNEAAYALYRNRILGLARRMEVEHDEP